MDNIDTTDVRGLLGLALRASRLVIGDEPTRDLIAGGHARAVFLASDAGAGIAKKAAHWVEDTHIVLLPLPCDKAALGGAFGRASCAICATSDMGFAAAVSAKLAPLSEAHADAAELLSRKNVRMQERKLKPKKAGAGAKVTEYTDIEEGEYRRRFGKKK